MVRGSIPYQNLAEKEDEQKWPFLFFDYNRGSANADLDFPQYRNWDQDSWATNKNGTRPAITGLLAVRRHLNSNVFLPAHARQDSPSIENVLNHLAELSAFRYVRRFNKL